MRAIRAGVIEERTGGPGVPAITLCSRIATNQRGPRQALLAQAVQGNTVTGATSGATGTFQRYYYSMITGVGEPEYVQQHALLSSVSGVFLAGETLTVT